MPLALYRNKHLLDAFIQSFLQDRENTISLVNPWGSDALKRLAVFAITGKSIRGSLVLFSDEAYSGAEYSENAMIVAASLELLHSGFLIHDDIMDMDSFRRGKPSVHSQYETMAQSIRGADSARVGIGMGISVGDLSFFLSQQCLAHIKKPDLYAAVARPMMEEASRVCVAQMQDVSGGSSGQTLRITDAESLYLYKTARYTCSLPLTLGAICAGIAGDELRILSEIGDNLGMIFQIRDDLLNLFGKPEVSGKSVQSDVVNGKRTLPYLWLLESLNETDRAQISAPVLTQADVAARIRNLESLGIRSIAEGKMRDYRGKSIEAIRASAMKDTHKRQLEDMMEYLMNRSK